MKTYLVTYNSTRWAGPDYYKFVEAEDEAWAEEIAEIECNEAMAALYHDEDEEHMEEEGLDYLDEAAANIVSVELFDKTHPLYKYKDSLEN